MTQMADEEPGPRSRRRAARPSRTAAVRSGIRRARAAWQRGVARVRPGARAWRAATWGVVIALTVVLAAGGTVLESGRPLLLDMLLVVVVGWIAAGLLVGLLLLLGKTVRWVPPRLRALGAVAIAVGAVPFAIGAGPSAALVSAAIVLAAGLTGAGLGTLVTDQPPRGMRMAAALLGLLVGAGALTAVGGWLLFSPSEPDGEPLAEPVGHEVATTVYGSGEHPHGPPFDGDVDLVTEPVDATALLPTWDGWRGTLRSWYWGFGPEALPRNATVWHPTEGGPYPLVLIVHGNAPMERPSDRGYAWLAERLAARGYVVASVDQNFLNLSLSRGFDLGDEADARGWLLLRHLELWRDWAGQDGHPLGSLADMDRIGLIGHSRGGEAVATAATFDGMQRYPEEASVELDAGFGIDALVALAPVDGQYEPGGTPRELSDVSYLVLQGGLDADVFWFSGLRQYHRTTLPEDAGAHKAAVYLPRANHGQFNTEWGRRDFAGVGGSVLDTEDILAGDTQRAVALTAIVPFLDATLGGDPAGLAVLDDPDDTAWPDDVELRVRRAHGRDVVLAGFGEDPDPATGTLPGSTISAGGLETWREVAVDLRRQAAHARAAELAWDDAAGWWAVTAPAGFAPPEDPVVRLDLAVAPDPPPGRDRVTEAPLDATLEVVDADGAVASGALAAHGGLAPTLPQERLKSPLPDWATGVDPIPRSFRFDVAQLSADDGFDPSALREIRLRFDQSVTGRVLVHEVAVGPGAP